MTKKSKFSGKKEDFVSSTHSVNIPSIIFTDRRLSVLEILVEYLKDEKNLNYSEIARLLNRDDRTIWTVYQRAKKKRVNEK